MCLEISIIISSITPLLLLSTQNTLKAYPNSRKLTVSLKIHNHTQHVALTVSEGD